MEKKGTKIAYFVALAVVVVALVIAKVTNDGSGFVATGWALFPPVPGLRGSRPAAGQLPALADGREFRRRR